MVFVILPELHNIRKNELVTCIRGQVEAILARYNIVTCGWSLTETKI